MAPRLILFALCLAAATPAAGRAGFLRAASAPPDCASSAAEAERRWALPPGLLLALGLAETGTRNPVTGQLEPASFAVNVAGSPVVFSAEHYAVDAVAALRRRGVGSIDVGCFQVNLLHHPAAFKSLQQAFDPRANADYAASFLHDLFGQKGDWGAAVAAYHSSDPRRGRPYRDRVLKFWSRTAQTRSALATPPAAKATTDPHVIRTTMAASQIPIFTPATMPPLLLAALRFYTKL